VATLLFAFKQKANDGVDGGVSLLTARQYGTDLKNIQKF